VRAPAGQGQAAALAPAARSSAAGKNGVGRRVVRCAGVLRARRRRRGRGEGGAAVGDGAAARTRASLGHARAAVLDCSRRPELEAAQLEACQRGRDGGAWGRPRRGRSTSPARLRISAAAGPLPPGATGAGARGRGKLKQQQGGATARAGAGARGRGEFEQVAVAAMATGRLWPGGWASERPGPRTRRRRRGWGSEFPAGSWGICPTLRDGCLRL